MPNDLQTIVNAVSAFDLSVPPEVTAAEKLLAAAEKLASDVAAETPPPMPKIAGRLRSYLDSLVAYSTTHSERLTAATALVDHARSEVDEAWSQSAEGFRETFRQLFNRAAADLQPALDALAGRYDHGDAFIAGLGPQYELAAQVANDLAALAAVRDAYAFRSVKAATASNAFEQWSRYFNLPNHSTAINTLPRLSAPRWSLPWLAEATCDYALRLTWQDAAEQVANSDRVCRPARVAG